MTFPAYIYLFGYQIHPHLLFESLAYTIGFQTFLRTRKFWKHPVVPQQQNLWLIVGCIFGALIGSKLLNMLEMPLDYWAHRDDIAYWLEGKTIVGGYIGGWLGVEIVKKKLGITYATGDAYVFPLIIGTAIGRVGCFLSGLQDQTYGTPTSLPWGIDFGDGIPRHPAQLYEIVTVLTVGVYLLFRIRRPYVNGWLFRFYMFTYFLFRFLVEFIKPRYHPLGLSAIQIASLAGAIYCARIFLRDNPYNFPANKRSSYV
ncbi:MAG: prolipoprotein diacylglyceryl transferase family protein [Candidatus Kapaibacterium sp.]